MNELNIPASKLSRTNLEVRYAQLQIMLFACRDKNKDFITFLDEHPKVEKDFKKWLAEKRKVVINDKTNITTSI
jgi:hypothetical protein